MNLSLINQVEMMEDLPVLINYLGRHWLYIESTSNVHQSLTPGKSVIGSRKCINLIDLPNDDPDNHPGSGNNWFTLNLTNTSNSVKLVLQKPLNL